MLYPAKLFVIMSLFNGDCGLSTGVWRRYEECNGEVGQYSRKRIETGQSDYYWSTTKTLAAIKNPIDLTYSKPLK
jgi:hypothetical protein